MEIPVSQQFQFPSFLLAAPLALGLAFAGAPEQAGASTLTGSVDLSISNATVSGTLDGDNNLNRIIIGGDFGTFNNLSCLNGCPATWTVSGQIDYGPSSTGSTGTSAATENGANGLDWSQVRTSFLDQNIPSLFTFVSFFDNMVVTALTSGGAASGTNGIGGSSVGWTVTGATLDDPGPVPIATSGAFTMTVNPDGLDGGLDGFLAVFGNFFQGDIAGLLDDDGAPFSASFTVAPSSADPSVIPLPASLPLLAGGLGMFGLMAWRRRSRATTGA